MAFLIYLFTLIAVLLVGAIPLLVSWAVINVLAYLICLCFALQYTILIGTGIWLIFIIVGIILG